MDQTSNSYRISANVQYLCRDNAWWEVRLRSTDNAAKEVWDVWLEREISQLTKSFASLITEGKCVQFLSGF